MYITTVEYIEEDEEDNSFTIELKEAETKEDSDGNVISITTGRTENGIGETQENNLFVSTSIKGKIRTLVDIGRTASHELGHAAGLKHPFHGASERDLDDNEKKSYEDNLMNSYGGSDYSPFKDYNPVKSTKGHVVTPQQQQTITKNVKSDT